MGALVHGKLPVIGGMQEEFSCLLCGFTVEALWDFCEV